MRSSGPGAATLAVVVMTGCSLIQGADASSGSGPVAGPGAGDLFVHGEVRRDGDPVAGAEVSLLIEDLGVAGETTTYDVPAVTTTEDGGYSFDIDPDELPGRFLAGDDYVSFDVSVTDEADAAAWSSSVWLVEDDGAWRARGADVSDAVPAVSFDLGRGTVEVTGPTGERTTYGE